MKRFLIVIVFFMITAMLFADIHGEVKAGKAIEQDIIFAEITIEYDFEFEKSILSLYASWLSWFQCTDQFMFFAPYQIIYSVGTEYGINNMFIDVNHFCNHPVYSGYGILEDLKRGENLTTISAGIKW